MNNRVAELTNVEWSKWLKRYTLRQRWELRINSHSAEIKTYFVTFFQFTVIVKTDESYLFKNFQKIRGKFIKKSIKWVEV